jgi:AraC-like DNA-binding protein
MSSTSSWAPRGILGGQAAQRRFRLLRRPAAPDLDPFVDYYWIVGWDLRGEEPYQVSVLTHPCVHLVFEPRGALVYGVIRGVFTYRLQGVGRAFGVRFRSGCFRPFLGSAVSAITDRSLGAGEIIGAEASAVQRTVLAAADEEEAAAVVDRFLRAVAPKPDRASQAVARMVEVAAADLAITRVGELARRLGVGTRTLQRLFTEYVGVSPKWVIRRYRLHEAAERAGLGPDVDWPTLATDLGYYDQAHLIRDFTATVGASPAQYARATAKQS